MTTKRPICSYCPKCGSRRFQSVRPTGFFAYRKDQQCIACDTAYSPPTPAWAAILFILIGLLLVIGCVVSLIIALARGWIAGLPLNLLFTVVGLLSLRQGIYGLREEIAAAPPLEPKSVVNIRDLKPWVWKHRTPFICVAAAIVVLLGFIELTRRSIAASAVREAQIRSQRRDAIRALEQVGGSVWGTGWDKDHATSIGFGRSELSRMLDPENARSREAVDADLEVIALFPDLRGLSLHGLEITDAGMLQLPPLPKLETLFVECPQVTENGLRIVAAMNHLEHLDLSGSGVRNLSKLELSRKLNFKTLTLYNTAISDDSASELAQLKSVKQLDLSATQVGDECLKSLGKLSNLEELKLSDTQVTDEGLVSLRPILKLGLLDVTNTHVTPAGIASLNRHLPNCQVRW